MWLSKIGRVIDKCITIVGNGGAAVGVIAIWVIAVTSSIEVLMRSGLGHAFTDVVTIGRMCMLIMGFLSAAYALRLNRHICITFVTDRLPIKLACRIRIVGSLLCLCMLAVMVALTFRYTWSGWELGSVLTTSWGNLPLWLFQVIVPIGLFMLSIQLVVNIVKDFRAMVGKGGREDLDAQRTSMPGSPE
jgi:TRAP-type C4-dicarboxylate transport system permease small subunit